MSRSRVDFHACCRKKELFLSLMCLMWVIPLLCKCLIKFVGSLCALPQPTHGSVPIWTASPSFILHVMPSQRSGNALMTTFHTLEMLLLVMCYCLNQSIRLIGHMYFTCATLDQRLFEVIRCQPSFAARALEKRSNLLIPHPPHLLGIAIVSHLTQANNLPG